MAVGDAVRDCVGVVEDDIDGDLVSVVVTEAERVTDGDDVRLTVLVGEAVVDRVTVAVGHGVAVTVRVAAELAVTLDVGVGAGVGDGISVSRTIIFTPEYTTDTSVVHCKYAAGPEEYTWAGRPPPDCEKISGAAAVGPSYIRM